MRAKEFIIENRIRNQETADSYLYNETDDINNNIIPKNKFRIQRALTSLK